MNDIPNDILELAKKEPTVYAAISSYRAGHLSWTVVLEQLVIVLANQKSFLQDELNKAINNSIAPNVFYIKKHSKQKIDHGDQVTLERAGLSAERMTIPTELKVSPLVANKKGDLITLKGFADKDVTMRIAEIEGGENGMRTLRLESI